MAAGGKDASLANLALMRRHGLGPAASYDLAYDRLLALLDEARKEGPATPAASALDLGMSSLSPLSWMSRLMFPAHLLDEPAAAPPPPAHEHDPFFDDPADPEELRGQIREIFASGVRKRPGPRGAG